MLGQTCLGTPLKDGDGLSEIAVGLHLVSLYDASSAVV